MFFYLPTPSLCIFQSQHDLVELLVLPSTGPIKVTLLARTLSGHATVIICPWNINHVTPTLSSLFTLPQKNVAFGKVQNPEHSINHFIVMLIILSKFGIKFFCKNSFALYNVSLLYKGYADFMRNFAPDLLLVNQGYQSTWNYINFICILIDLYNKNAI